jgi:hypothetical protein
MFKRLRPPPDHTIPFLVLVAFLVWILISRTFIYFFPTTFVTIDGSHIHHFSWGVIALSIFAFILLIYPFGHRARLRLAIPLGVALALVYDEYAIWFLFGGSYRDRHNYDAILLVALVLLNITYLPGFWSRWGRRLEKLLNIIFLGLPRLIYHKFKQQSRKLSKKNIAHS